VLFDSGAENIHWRENSLFNKCCLENWLSTCRRLNLDPYFSKINSKWISELKIRPKTLNYHRKTFRGNT
jgi:hypothetical protein